MADATSTVRVEIEESDGTIRTWTGEAAEEWKRRVNSALFMMQNHGMTVNIPSPTEIRKTGG